MTKANYVQRGESLDYTNSTNKVIPAGAIIEIGDHIGVSGTDIAPGAVGSIHMVGVFEIDKSKSSEVIAQGASVYFDGVGITGSSGEGEEPKPDTTLSVIGYAAAPSAAGDETVTVKLCG